MQMHWEEGADAELAYPPASALLSLLESNPFAPIQEMESDEFPEWQPYDRAEAERALQQYRIAGISIRSMQPFLLRGDVSRSSFQNNVNLYVSDALVRTIEVEAMLRLTRQVAAALPQFLESRSSADPHLRELIHQYDLPNLPAFNFMLGWAHLVSPRGIAPYYLPEDLLQAPAYRVQQLENGLIEMLVYPHPLAYELPENRQRIIELTRYFAAKRRQ